MDDRVKVIVVTPRQVVPGFRWDKETKTGYLDLRVNGRGSHRRRRTFRGLSYRAALAKFGEIKDELRQEREPDGIPALAAYVETYKRLRPIALATQRTYSGMLRKILPTLGGLPLDQVTLDKVLEFRTTLLAEGASHATANRYTTLIRMLLNEAVQRSILGSHPIPSGTLKPLREPRPVPAYLSDDERERLLAAFDEELAFRQSIKQTLGPIKEGRRGLRRYGGSLKPDSTAAGHAFQRFNAAKPLLLCALDTGLSKGDLRTLTWRQIDLEQRLILTTRKKSGVPTTIPLTKRLYEALMNLDHREGSVFLSHAGEPWDESTLNRYFTRAKRLANITRPFRFHDLRHDFASNLATKGVSLYTISQLLGHTTTTMTQRYAHLSPDNLRQAIDTL